MAVFTPSTAAYAALAYWIGAEVVRQVGEMAAGAPRLLGQTFRIVLGGGQGDLFGWHVQADELAGQVCERLGASLTPADTVVLVGTVFGVLMGGVLTIVLYFFFLYGAERLLRGALWLVPPGRRDQVHALARRVHPVLWRYVAGTGIVVLFTSAASWVVLALVLRIPHAALLALATGLLELVPMIGPVASAALVSGAAVAQGGVWLLLAFLVFYIILRLVIDQVVGPLILGRAVRLSPVVILFAFLAGGTLYGPLGVLLAVPAAATLKIVLAAYYDEPEAKRPPL